MSINEFSLINEACLRSCIVATPKLPKTITPRSEDAAPCVYTSSDATYPTLFDARRASVELILHSAEWELRGLSLELL